MSDIASFRKVLAYAPQPNLLLQVIDDKIVIEVANGAYLKLFGVAEDSITQNDFFNTPNFRHTDINASVVLQLKASIQQCVQSNNSITLLEQAFTVYQLIQNSIQHLTLSFTITPVADKSTNNITLVLVSLTNETEKATQKNTCELLRKQVQDCKTDIAEIENALRIGRWEIDVVNKKLSWSDEVFTICGYAPQAFDPSEKQQFSITHPDDVELTNQALNNTIKFGTPFFTERRLIKADGEILHVLSKGKAIKNEAGEVIKVKGFFQDITELVLQNQAINTIKAHQEALINSTNDLLWLMDTQLNVLIANDAYLDKMNAYAGGHSSDTIEKVKAARKLKWVSYLPEVLKGNSVSFKEKNFNPISNQLEFGLVTINPIKNNNGEVENIACFAKDITTETNNILKLENTNNRIENILAASPDVICSLDGNAIFLDVSAASQKVLGYKPEEMIGKSIAAFLPPEDLAKTLAEAPKVRETGVLIHFENRYFKKDASIVNMSWTGSYLAEKDILYCVGRDITEKKKQELALLASQKEYQSLFDNNPSALLIWNFETKNIIECNAKALDLYGYTKEEFLQLSVRDIRPEDELEKFDNATTSEIAYNNATTTAWKHKRKNGDTFFINVSKHLIDYKGVRCALIMVTDITEQLKIQKAIAENEAKYRSLFENSVDGIFITKKTGGILDASPSGCKMLQMTKEEVCRAGRNGILDTTDPRLEVFLNERERFGYAKGIITHIRKDGSKFDAEVSSSTFTDATGESVNALIVRDITQWLKQKALLQESYERFNYVTKATSEAIWDWNLITGEVFWGDGFKIIFGYSNEEIIPRLDFRLQRIHPRDKEKVLDGMYTVIKGADSNWEDSYRFLKADGTYVKVINRGFVIRDKAGKAIRMVGAKRDISQDQYYSEIEKLERNILAINEAGDKTLEEVLSIYLLGIEVLHPGMICSILQLKGNQLFSLASPSLAEGYTNAINGVVIGNNVGSCGTAAFTKKNVIVTDIAKDPYWTDYKKLAADYGLKACWSHPIFNQKDEVIATFAAYYQQTKSPTAIEQNTITRASNILKIILESYARTQALKDSNERYLLATKATSDAIWDWDLLTGYLILTEGWQSIFGFDVAKMPNDISFLLQNTHPDDVETIRKSYYEIVRSKETNWERQYRLKKANGEYAFVISKGFVTRDSSGWAIRMVGATRDITQRKKEELRLKLLESVITNTKDAVLITDSNPIDMPGPRIIYVNNAFTEMTGYTAEEVIGKTPRILQGPKSNRQELQRLKASLRNWESCEVTLVNHRKDKSEFWVNINISPVADETGWYTHWVAIQRDITEKMLEEQKLTKAIIKAQENERYEIGGELHDNVCQILTSSQLSLKMLKKVLGPKELVWYEKGTEAITLASREIRNLSHRLAPSFFNDTTLELAITTLVRTFNIEEGYDIHILFDDRFKTLPTKQEFQINLYRIVQEQLKNILKYAEATVIEIVGTVKSGQLTLEIIDNGVGFDTNIQTFGIGMANMKRRTELFLGKFNVLSEPSKGCKIVVQVPLDEIKQGKS